MPSFSLVGALEFRRVVSSLQRDASYASLARFGSPLTPYAYRGSRHHQHSRSRTPLRTPGGGYAEEDPWDTALSLDQRRSPAPVYQTLQPPLDETSHEGVESTPLPSISHTPASPTSVADTDTESQTYIEGQYTRRQRVYNAVAHVAHILFPTLNDFWSFVACCANPGSH